MRSVSAMLCVMLAALGIVFTGDVRADTRTAAKTGDAKTAAGSAKTGTRDPVAMAFALPKGTVLNSQQQAAYNKLKRTNESPLRSAIQQMAQTSDKSEKAKLARQANDVRAKIHTGMDEILAMPAIAAQKAAVQQYQARAAEMRAARASASSGACPCGR